MMETSLELIKSRALSGRRIAVLATNGFEYVELLVPKRAFQAAGAKVEVVSIDGGKIRGVNLTEPARTVAVDRRLAEASPQDYDALFIPGGFINPDFLRQSRAAREFARRFDEGKMPIATLCHGPWLLVSAGLVSGRALASWPSLRDDIVNAGGIWRDEPVVRDRNWVSSRGPQDLHEFIPAAIELFASAEGRDVPYPTRESSPERDHPSRAALTAARVLPGPMLTAMAGGALLALASAAALRKLAA
jgi:protease I